MCKRSFFSWVHPYCLSRCASRRMCTWRGFEVDPRWGAFRMAGELLLAIKRLRSTVKTHTRRKHTYRHILYTHGHTQSETEERQYSMRQESGLQSTIPASSYLVGSILETRPNQTRQVRSVKKHGFFFFFYSARIRSSLWVTFLSHYEV